MSVCCLSIFGFVLIGFLFRGHLLYIRFFSMGLFFLFFFLSITRYNLSAWCVRILSLLCSMIFFSCVGSFF